MNATLSVLLLPMASLAQDYYAVRPADHDDAVFIALRGGTRDDGLTDFERVRAPDTGL